MLEKRVRIVLKKNVNVNESDKTLFEKRARDFLIRCSASDIRSFGLLHFYFSKIAIIPINLCSNSGLNRSPPHSLVIFYILMDSFRVMPQLCRPSYIIIPAVWALSCSEHRHVEGQHAAYEGIWIPLHDSGGLRWIPQHNGSFVPDAVTKIVSKVSGRL